MFLKKKHIARRTVLKAAGVKLALPFLNAMVPPATALAQTPSDADIQAAMERGKTTPAKKLWEEIKKKQQYRKIGRAHV